MSRASSSRRLLPIVIAAVFAVVVAVGVTRLVGQTPASPFKAEAPPVARWQVIPIVPGGHADTNGNAILLDTSTGETWLWDGAIKWNAISR